MLCVSQENCKVQVIESKLQKAFVTIFVQKTLLDCNTVCQESSCVIFKLFFLIVVVVVLFLRFSALFVFFALSLQFFLRLFCQSFLCLGFVRV
jgi:hypothetical protein